MPPGPGGPGLLCQGHGLGRHPIMMISRLSHGVLPWQWVIASVASPGLRIIRAATLSCVTVASAPSLNQPGRPRV